MYLHESLPYHSEYKVLFGYLSFSQCFLLLVHDPSSIEEAQSGDKVDDSSTLG